MAYVPLSTYLTPELKTALNQRAHDDGKTVRDIVEAALASYLASKDDSPPIKRLNGISRSDAVEHGLNVMTWLHAQGRVRIRSGPPKLHEYDCELMLIEGKNPSYGLPRLELGVWLNPKK